MGQIALTGKDDGTWKILLIDTGVFGTNLIPLRVGNRFCADIVASKWGDAFTLLTPEIVAQVPSATALAGYFTLSNGATNTACTPNLSTYQVKGVQAQYDIGLTITATDGRTATVKMTVFLLINSTGAWKVDGWKFS